MTYWKQFAEMLGLELEQEFSLTKSNGEKLDMASYKITEDGIYYQPAKGIDWFEEPSDTLDFLLSGEFVVLPKPWKPKIYEQYWYCSTITQPVVVATTWGGFSNDLCKWKCGNCFKTKKEAEIKGKQIMEQIIKEFEEK
jgi:hypothetical protein|nr:MAG TPA: hypothetical protein [Caudoviricetes sp.]